MCTGRFLQFLLEITQALRNNCCQFFAGFLVFMDHSDFKGQCRRICDHSTVRISLIFIRIFFKVKQLRQILQIHIYTVIDHILCQTAVCHIVIIGTEQIFAELFVAGNDAVLQSHTALVICIDLH